MTAPAMTTTTDTTKAESLAWGKFRQPIHLSVNQRRLVALELARRVNQRHDGNLTGDEATGLVERVAHPGCPNPHLRFYVFASAVEDRDRWEDPHGDVTWTQVNNQMEAALDALLTVKHPEPDRPLAVSPETIRDWHDTERCHFHADVKHDAELCCVCDYAIPCELAIDATSKWLTGQTS